MEYRIRCPKRGCGREARTRSACGSSTSVSCCRRSGCTAAAEGRDRAPDAPDGADGADHHRPPRGRRIGAQAPPVRGKVGQPSVPMALNPDGAFSIGVKIGRRSIDMLLVDFTGQVRERLSLDYPFPDPDTLFTEIGTRLRQLRKALKPALRERLQGIGVAAPLSLGGWKELLGIAPELAAKWHGIDMRERMAALGATAGCRSSSSKTLPPPVSPNWWPAAAAASAASCTSSSTPSSEAAWCSTATCRVGVTGNAGAVGSLPMGSAAARKGPRATAQYRLAVEPGDAVRQGWRRRECLDRRARAGRTVAAKHTRLAERGLPGHRTGHQQRCLSARSGGRDHRRFVRPRVAALR